VLNKGLTAFAANSVLCRLALGSGEIGAASFTVIRLLSGAVTLLIINQTLNWKKKKQQSGSWRAAFYLFSYAAAFSYAYITLDTGTGALILFGAVQLTMILYAQFSGDKLRAAEWFGVAVAFAGFVYLVIPNLSVPSSVGFVLMTISGIAWGVYTIIGKSTVDPLPDTAANFTKALPLAALLSIWIFMESGMTAKGFLLAAISGGAASGIGYTIWYAALRGLSTTQAAVAQLLVPIIAAAGGVIFVSETLSIRLIISTILVLGGIALVVAAKIYAPPPKIVKQLD